MARQTVGTIFSNISATVNQDPTQPQEGSADFLLWLQFLNRAQTEWSEAYDWEELRKDFRPNVSGPTITLPADFKKVSAPVLNYSVGVTDGVPWSQETPDRLQFRNPSTDSFFIITGDPGSGSFMQWYPGTLASGASIYIPYYAMPTSLASSTQYPVMSNSEYLSQRVIAYVFEGRSDPRYQDEERKAREMLLQMIDNSSVAKYSSYNNPIRILSSENRRGFRFGRN